MPEKQVSLTLTFATESDPASVAAHVVEIEQLRAEVDRLHAGEEPGSTPHGNLTDGQWLRLFNEAGPAQRLAIINCLRGEAARGFLMDHAGRLNREQRARVAPERTAPADEVQQDGAQS